MKDYSRKRWLILSLLSVEIDMMLTWLTPIDLADREMTVLQVVFCFPFRFLIVPLQGWSRGRQADGAPTTIS